MSLIILTRRFIFLLEPNHYFLHSTLMSEKFMASFSSGPHWKKKKKKDKISNLKCAKGIRNYLVDKFLFQKKKRETSGKTEMFQKLNVSEIRIQKSGSRKVHIIIVNVKKNLLFLSFLSLSIPAPAMNEQ